MRARAVLFLLWMAAQGLTCAPLDSQDPAAITQRAQAEQQAGNFSAAAADYRLLIRAGQDSPELRSNLGLMLYLSNQYRGAWEEFRAALARKPGLLASNLFGGLSLVRLGEPRQALPLLEKAKAEQPQGPAPLLALGRAYVSLGQPLAAFENYRQATVIDSANAEAWYGRGITARHCADLLLSRKVSEAGGQTAQEYLTDADRSLSRATALDPDSTKAHMILGEAFRISRQMDQSVAEYQIVIKSRPDFEPAYLGLATTYWKFDRVEDAMNNLKKALALTPGDPEANGIMAYLLVASRELEQARPFAERALAGRPDLAFVRFALARIYLSEKQPEKAVSELERAAPDDPDGSYHFVLAQTLRKLGRTGEANEAMEQSRKLRDGGRS